MLFIDNGGGHFDGSVKNLLRKVFPGKPLVDVPNDDPIYQRPYVFPDGAPSFWHHAGYRAMGIREDGRWLVYYLPATSTMPGATIIPARLPRLPTRPTSWASM